VNNFDSTTMKPIVPKGLYAEGETGAASYLVAFPLGAMPLNQAVCLTALAFGKDAGAPDAGTNPGSDAAASPDGTVSGTGSTHGSNTGGSPGGGQGGERDGGMHVGGTNGRGGASGNAGGAPRSNVIGTGGQSSDETGGASSGSNAAADAGGGCRVSTVAQYSSGSGLWPAALAIGFASVRRSRRARPRQL
jgi:hypothetical protein